MKARSGLQIPDRSGFPEAVRGAGPLGADALIRSAVSIASPCPGARGARAAAIVTTTNIPRMLFLRLVIRRQTADPDIAIAHRLLMVLQYQGIFLRLRPVVRELAVKRRTH